MVSLLGLYLSTISPAAAVIPWTIGGDVHLTYEFGGRPESAHRSPLGIGVSATTRIDMVGSGLCCDPGGLWTTTLRAEVPRFHEFRFEVLTGGGPGFHDDSRLWGGGEALVGFGVGTHHWTGFVFGARGFLGWSALEIAPFATATYQLGRHAPPQRWELLVGDGVGFGLGTGPFPNELHLLR